MLSVTVRNSYCSHVSWICPEQQR